MTNPRPLIRGFLTLVLALSLNATAAVSGGNGLSKGAATQAYSWYEGMIRYSSIINCVSMIQGTPYVENGVGTYVGFYADPDAGQPAPNIPYYVHVVVAGLGNSCSGIRAYIDIYLPANTSLAIDASRKVNYYYDNVKLSDAESPQSLSLSSYNPGAYQLLSTDNANANTWPIPQGRILEIQIPVVSSTALSGSILQANVWALDGNDSPWLRPQQGVYVFSTQPAIVYSSPSTINITKTDARSQATLFCNGAGGTGYFDLGTSTSYGMVHESVTIAPGMTSALVWDDWGPGILTPGTLYHWRFTFTTGGVTYYGEDQTFTTLPDTVPTSTRASSSIVRSRPGREAPFDVLGRARPDGSPRIPAAEVTAGRGTRAVLGR